MILRIWTVPWELGGFPGKGNIDCSQPIVSSGIYSTLPVVAVTHGWIDDIYLEVLGPDVNLQPVALAALLSGALAWKPYPPWPFWNPSISPTQQWESQGPFVSSCCSMDIFRLEVGATHSGSAGLPGLSSQDLKLVPNVFFSSCFLLCELGGWLWPLSPPFLSPWLIGEAFLTFSSWSCLHLVLS